MKEPKDLLGAVKSYQVFCLRQDRLCEAMDCVDDCVRVINDFAAEYKISLQMYDFFCQKINATFRIWRKLHGMAN